MLEKLMNSPVAWTILAIIAVVSFIYAIVCQQKNKEKKELSYARNSNSLILKKKSQFEKLSVSYDGQLIEDLCVSKYVIWNSGNKTLNDSDIVTTKEITIKTINNNTILDSEVVSCSENTNNFVIEHVNNHAIKINFDYVDPKDGVVVQIIHTGTREDIKILCKIKGGKDLKAFATTSSSSVKTGFSKKFSAAYLFVATTLLSVCTVLLSVISVLVEKRIITNEEFLNNFLSTEPIKVSPVLYIFFVLLIIFMFFMSTKIMKSEFMIGIPKKLKKYFAKELE